MTLYEAACNVSRKAAAGFAHPVAIVGFLPLCVAYWLYHPQDDFGTYALSVFAITTSQLILLAQDRDTKALHVKIDELLRGVPAADEKLAGIEKG